MILRYTDIIGSWCLQNQTMQMMYTIVAKELLNSVDLNDSHMTNAFGNLGKVPQDYLNFYCLGNREKMPHSTIQVSDAKTVGIA